MGILANERNWLLRYNAGEDEEYEKKDVNDFC